MNNMDVRTGDSAQIADIATTTAAGCALGTLLGFACVPLIPEFGKSLVTTASITGIFGGLFYGMDKSNYKNISTILKMGSFIGYSVTLLTSIDPTVKMMLTAAAVGAGASESFKRIFQP